MIYRTRGEHANHYATDAVQTNEEDKYTCELCTKSNQIQREWIASVYS
jgi:hypothetical protein